MSTVCPNCGDNVEAMAQFCSSCGTDLSGKIVTAKKSTRQPVQFTQHTAPYAGSSTNNFKAYIQVIATLEIVFGIFALFVGMLMILLSSVIDELLAQESDIPAGLNEFVGTLLVFIAIVFLTYAVTSIVFGVGLFRYKNYGRVGTMVIGALNILNFPFGTIFGLATLYVLTLPEVEQLFTR